ncbi:MAG: hypothetical protein AAGF07_04045 [Patescibacteria group bacterium]
MSIKTKILSLLILGLLLLPSILGPRTGGSVLGVLDSRQDEKSTSPAENEVKVGEIASGAFETRVFKSNQSQQESMKGKVIWDENAKSPVVTDKFSLGQSLKVNTGSSSYSLIVSDVRVLSENTLLVLDKNTFIELGGNPSMQDSMTVSVKKE